MDIASSQPILDGIAIVNGDKKSVAYRPQFARLTGSATAAILLQQIMFLWDSKDRQPFYKFKSPCGHEKYRAGDSWCEELAFTEAEFDNAIKKVGTKIKRGTSKQAALDWNLPRIEDFSEYEGAYEQALLIAIQHCVVYWTDGSRLTWYTINANMLNALVLWAYEAKPSNMVLDAKPSLMVYLDKARNMVYLGKRTKKVYLYSESPRDNTENNTSASPVEKPKRIKPDRTPKEVIPAPDVALIDAYHYSLPEDIRPSKAAYSRYRELATAMVKSGITPYDVVRYVSAESSSYRKWAAEHNAKLAMSLNHVDQEIKGWLQTHRTKPRSAPIAYTFVEHDDYVSDTEAA